MARILIIDDDRSIGEMLKILLEFHGHNAYFSDRPLEAKEIIQKHNSDLILLDMRLSGVDGTDICRELKNDDETRDIPVIMMSALLGASKDCEEAGADDFVLKPFEMEKLISTIDGILGQYHKKAK